MTDREFDSSVEAACGFILFLFVIWLLWPSSRATADDASKYYFTLPVMFYECMTYPLRSGETFRGWKIEQRMVLDASDPGLHDVTIRDIFMNAGALDCPSVRF